MGGVAVCPHAHPISILNFPVSPGELPIAKSSCRVVMGKKKVLVSYGVDIDAVAGWLGSYGGEDSTSDISRGE
jgi:hypothetical protein